jgi:putative membrane protein insertion efficiency factor
MADRESVRWWVWPAIGLVRLYQLLISPILGFLGGPGTGCRFHPTCSHYSIEALKIHGLFRGGWLTARRLCKCGPWHPGGIDDVPPRDGRVREASDRSIPKMMRSPK